MAGLAGRSNADAASLLHWRDERAAETGRSDVRIYDSRHYIGLRDPSYALAVGPFASREDVDALCRQHGPTDPELRCPRNLEVVAEGFELVAAG